MRDRRPGIKDIYGTEKKEKFIFMPADRVKPQLFFGRIFRISLVGFFLVMLINLLNVYTLSSRLEKNVTDSALSGVGMLLEGGIKTGKTEFENAQKAFLDADENFKQMQNELWFISGDHSFYARNHNLSQSLNALILSGRYFSLAGENFVLAMEKFQQIPLLFFNRNTLIPKGQTSLSGLVKEGLFEIEKSIATLQKAQARVATVDSLFFPPHIAEKIVLFKQNMDLIGENLAIAKTHFPAILKLLGDKMPHRYLILFQNNNEIRPTGGFIGSYAIIDINDGYIEKMEVHDSYDLDGAYGGFIEPPEKINKFVTNWRFRDSNYSYDFPTSASKARWLMEKEGGPGVNTIIAINQDLLATLLEITGPVILPGFGEFNKDNYNNLLTYVIESKAWGAEDPKQILKRLVPLVKKELFKSQNFPKLSGEIYRAIQQKNILFWSPDSEIQDLFVRLGISGGARRSEEEKEDYLSVIHFSVGGTKPEQFTRETISHNTSIRQDGTVINDLTIERRHLWSDDLYFSWQKLLNDYGFRKIEEYVINIMGRGDNVTDVFIYVPVGSKLIGKNPEMETLYDSEINKTYFRTRMRVPSGQEATLSFSYQLPFKIDPKTVGAYKIFIEKQPGSRGSLLNKTLSFVGKMPRIIDFYPPEAQKYQSGEIGYSGNLVYDRFFSVLFAPE